MRGNLFHFSNNTPEVTITGMHASSVPKERHLDWKRLKQSIPPSDMPWLILGDLNEVTKQSEKSGGRPFRDSQCKDFKEFTDKEGVVDLGFHGAPFTWTNTRKDGDLIRQRLDMALSSLSWLDFFPHTKVLHLTRTNYSDHCPLLIYMSNPYVKGPFPLRAMSRIPCIDEVQECLFRMNPMKCPGPDGVQPRFFQHYWSDLGSSIYNFVLSSFQNCEVPASVNKSYIALIPKIENPSKISEFRPIGVGSANDNPGVDRWLQKVKNVSYFAANVMDDYDYEIIRRNIELGENLMRKKKVCNFFSPSNNPLVFRFRMTHKVLEILSKFDELDKEAKRIGLKQVKLLDKSVPTTSNAGRENLEIIRKNAIAIEVIGREDDKQKLLEMMCSPENDKEHLFTIAIVGLGGFGKTTLTRALYQNEEKVAKHFDNKMWVCVSEDFNVERILKEMVELLSSKKCDLTNMAAIREELEKELKDKRFLLVLDDVWKEDKALWDSLKNQLRVVVKVNIPTPSHKEVGHRIVKKCNGVPLAITTMGGLLQSKERIQYWESIENNEVWATSSENDPNYILPSLFLSYQHLPSLSLKQCFAYCATFPKDHIMDKNELIDLWISQGFLTLHETSNSTLTMEKMGEDYFQTLLNISFLQLEEDNWTEESAKGEVWKCKMHDLGHDLAIHIFKEELFIWEAKS
uniref:Uncharacterized protein n=1 Tax=Chenopodium quinoa TaxID=63459 RepID=A0A803MEG3_CHEQI